MRRRRRGALRLRGVVPARLKVGSRVDVEVEFVVGVHSTVSTVADCDAVRLDLHERLAALGHERSVVVAVTADRRWAV